MDKCGERSVAAVAYSAAADAVAYSVVADAYLDARTPGTRSISEDTLNCRIWRDRPRNAASRDSIRCACPVPRK